MHSNFLDVVYSCYACALAEVHKSDAASLPQSSQLSTPTMPRAKRSTTKKSSGAKPASTKQAKVAAAAPQDGTEAPPQQTGTRKPRGLTPPLQTRSNRKKAASDAPQDDNGAAPKQVIASKATIGTRKPRASTRKASSESHKAAPTGPEKNPEAIGTTFATRLMNRCTDGYSTCFLLVSTIGPDSTTAEESAGCVLKGNTPNSNKPSDVGHEAAGGVTESSLQDKSARAKVCCEA